MAARMRPTQLAMSSDVVLEPEKSFFRRSFEPRGRRYRWVHGGPAERVVWCAVHTSMHHGRGVGTPPGWVGQ